MSILITGASGFVGSYLASKFSKQNRNLLLISKKKKFSINRNLIQQVDINNLKELEKLFKNKIDYIIHCASLNESLTNKYKKLAYSTALKGTENLLKLSIKYNVKKFFFFSVLQVYGKEISGIIKSKEKIKIENDYTKSHYLAEEIIKKYNEKYKLNINILRLSYSFSCPIDNRVHRPDLIPINFCMDAINKNEICLNSDGNSRRDFIYLRDVFIKISKIMHQNSNKDIYYNFSSGKTFKIIEIAKIVQEEASKILGKKIKLKLNLNNKLKENKFVVPSNIYVNKIKKIYIKKKLRYEIKKIIINYIYKK
jgi:UDP-glucose 4-epimerase